MLPNADQGGDRRFSRRKSSNRRRDDIQHEYRHALALHGRRDAPAGGEASASCVTIFTLDIVTPGISLGR